MTYVQYVYICNIVKCSQKNSHTVKKHIHIHLYIRIFCRHSACWHCETSYIYLYNYIMIQWCHTSKETTNIISIYFIYIPIFIPSFIYYYFTCIYIYICTHTYPSLSLSYSHPLVHRCRSPVLWDAAAAVFRSRRRAGCRCSARGRGEDSKGLGGNPGRRCLGRRWGSALINAETKKKNNKTTCPNLHL